MNRFLFLPLLAIIGIIFVIRTVIAGSVPQPIAAPVITPPKSPFSRFVAGSGIIEASSENISIASPLAGVIKQVFVKAGDHVTLNQPLFALDDRDILAEISVREAQVTRSQALLEDTQTQLAIYRSVNDARAIMRGELLKRESAVSVAKAGVAEAEALLSAARTTLERMTIRAPIDGAVLQSKARVGEFAPAQVLSTPLMVIGSVAPLAVRVDIDENDAWRVAPGKRAIANLRGNTSISFPLIFVRFEPYVIPKRSLTGESFERVDTRVLQAIYSFDKGTLPVYVGQLVDVYIESEQGL
ncbi:MAG: efflux RND transporter periplasmic adaptor subunit [Pseudomonadota bacterium]|jgi:HlyD family secretion protein